MAAHWGRVACRSDEQVEAGHRKSDGQKMRQDARLECPGRGLRRLRLRNQFRVVSICTFLKTTACQFWLAT
jgi:hypothetical protein